MAATQKSRLPWSQSHTSPCYPEHFRIYKATPELERVIFQQLKMFYVLIPLGTGPAAHLPHRKPWRDTFPCSESPRSYSVIDKACIYKFLKFIPLEEQSRPRRYSPQNAGTEPPTREVRVEGTDRDQGSVLHKPPTE